MARLVWAPRVSTTSTSPTQSCVAMTAMFTSAMVPVAGMVMVLVAKLVGQLLALPPTRSGMASDGVAQNICAVRKLATAGIALPQALAAATRQKYWVLSASMVLTSWLVPVTRAVWTMVLKSAAVETSTRYVSAPDTACQLRVGRLLTLEAPLAGLSRVATPGSVAAMARFTCARPRLFGSLLSVAVKPRV